MLLRRLLFRWLPPNLTVHTVRAAAEALLAWCDDSRAERAVLGSILGRLLPSVATPTEPDDGPTHEQIDRSRAENGLPPLYAAEQDAQPVDWCKGTPEQVAEARAEVAATEARHSVGWEYATTTGPRKAWDAEDVPPEGEGWIRNIARGDNGWERFDYHEESYWKRPKPPAEQDGQR